MSNDIKKDKTAAVIDNLLKFAMAGGVVSVAVIAPNAIQILGKPLEKIFDKLDKRESERELRRIIYYMKQRNLIKLKSENYEHGLVISNKGRKRALKSDLQNINVKKLSKWDGRWRLVFFDIPESKRYERIMLTSKLKQIGFKQLQYSAWIHPFPCRSEVESITIYFKIEKYVSYVEIVNIDNEQALKSKFRKVQY